jgi:hypothetical protein
MARAPSLRTSTARLTAARQGRNAAFWDEGLDEHQQDVDSSAIRTVGYDEHDQTLTITFLRSGITYSYYNVPMSVYRRITQAGSPGRYFNANIRNRYAYSRG